MSKHLTPLEVVERLVAPIEEISEITVSNRKAAYKWRHASKWADAGDFRSMRHVRMIVGHAQASGIPLTLAHLVFGAPEDQIAAIEEAMRDQPMPMAAAE